MLEVITDQKTIAACQRKMEASIKRAAKKRARYTIGFPSGSMEADVCYLPRLDFWVGFEAVHNRYWTACGLGDPFAKSAPAPQLEINAPFKGINRQTAGAFVKDDDGNCYLAHSGRVGGGAKGVGLTNFLAYYPAHTPVDFDGRPRRMYVVGYVTDPKLPNRMASLTRMSAEFRTAVKAGNPAAVQPNDRQGDDYHDEFQGTKRYETSSTIEANVAHGKVVKGLRDLLLSRKITACNDMRRDLFVPGKNGKMKMLFEVKTDTDTGSVYQAIGQLFFHGGNGFARKLVAVLPEDLRPTFRQKLDALGIATVTYGWSSDESPAFRDLARVLKAAGA